MEVTSTSIVESRLEAIHVAITKLGFTQNEYDALQ
jgi:hypothetical protein